MGGVIKIITNKGMNPVLGALSTVASGLFGYLFNASQSVSPSVQTQVVEQIAKT